MSETPEQITWLNDEGQPRSARWRSLAGHPAPARVVLLTECSMSDNVAAESPTTQFIRPCNLCPHMKRITLENIYDALRLLRHEVVIPEDVAARARVAIERMLSLPRAVQPADFATGRDPVDVTVMSAA